MSSSYDVIVIGGGTAGVVAAIQAARAGAKTLLVEKTGMLGGTMTNGGIPAVSSFHAYDRQVIAGIGWELCCRARDEAGAPPPPPRDRSERAGGRSALPVNPAIYAAVADEMVLAAGAELLFHVMPAAAKRQKQGWQLTLCTKTGLRKLAAKVLVDCTGDANVVSLAGLETVRSPEQQAATLVAKAAGYDDKALDYPAIQKAFEAEVAAGRMRRSDPGWGRGDFGFFLRGYGGNRIHVADVGGNTSEERTRAEIEGRRIMLNILRFCRQQPGLENFTITSCAPECGIRETVTIKGQTTVTVADYVGGRKWDDAVCYSFYGIDVHHREHCDFRAVREGVYPTIPLGALLPAGGRNLIVAGRCAAGDQEANSAFRVEASCMAMGQAAGAAAALAAKRGIELGKLPVDDLRNLLRQHQAIVPFDV